MLVVLNILKLRFSLFIYFPLLNITCLVEGCTIPRALKDYQENKTLTQVASCLSNIQLLLLNKQPEPEVRQDNKVRQDSQIAQDSQIVQDSQIAQETSNSRQRRRKSSVLTELKQIATSEVSGRKSSSRTRTKSAKVNPEIPATETTGTRKSRRQSLPDKRKGTARKETSTNCNEDKEKAKQRNNLEKKNTKGETKLHVACNKGSVESVKELLGLGANPNTQDYAGWTPLHDVVSHGRLDLAELLLSAEANPSVPSHDERTTALHDAVSSGEGELVRLLVSRGADRDAKDKFGQTPRSLAAQSEVPGIREILEGTEVVVNLNETVKNSSQSKKVNICLSKKLGKQPSVTKLCSELCQIEGLDRPGLEVTAVTSSTTHLVVAEAEQVTPLTFQYLAALAVGASIVREAWLTESLQQGKVVGQEMFEVKFEEEDQEGWNKVKEMISAQQPGLLAGLHFYLGSNIVSGTPALGREELAILVRLCGGRLVGREPDPEGIPDDEVSVHHHALPDSPLAGTSHVILYQEGEGGPQIKYNMKHIKTLPVSWLVNCVRRTSLIDP